MKYKPQTRGELIRTLNRFSENYKWFAGGFAGLLVFSYDKIDCIVLRIVGALTALFGILLFVLASHLFGQEADEEENDLEKVGQHKRQELIPKGYRVGTQNLISAEWWAKLGLLCMAIYAILFFGVRELLCPKKESPAGAANLTVHFSKDSITGIPHISTHIDPVLHNVYFDFNKADLQPESFRELDSLVGILNRYPGKKAEISGYTDDKGNNTYNLKLSRDRADAVTRYLIKQKNIPAGSLQARGYGESTPVASNNTDEGRELNRRVEFKFLN